MNKFLKIMKICKSVFEYVGNPLYKKYNPLEAGVWRKSWHGLHGLKTPVPIYPPNTGFEGIIT
jgi:hypothetical protein